MEFESYLNLLNMQHKSMTKEQIEAIVQKNRLHKIACEKMQVRDQLEMQYRELFVKGFQKLSSTSNVLELLPEFNSEIEMTKALFDNVKNNSSQTQSIINSMRNIPEFIECEKLNVEVAKANFEFFCAKDELNRRINSDREILFSNKYRERMRQLADNGILLYYLETPDLPLLDNEFTADYILKSFSFNDYFGARELLTSFYQTPNPGVSLQRKLEDARAALEMMYNGCYRSAARNWFALIEHEHKRCSDTLEGYWEAKKEYKNGGQRSKKIYEIINNMMGDWEQEAWKKIDTFYKKLTGNQKHNDIALNRDTIIHGDYYSDSIDVSQNDSIRLFLLWINLRTITNRLAFLEDFIKNKVTLLPYFCSVLPNTD